MLHGTNVSIPQVISALFIHQLMHITIYIETYISM